MNNRAEILRAVVLGESERVVNGLFRCYHGGRRVLAEFMSERLHTVMQAPLAKAGVLVAAAMGGAMLVTIACNRGDDEVAKAGAGAAPPVRAPVQGYPIAQPIPAAAPQMPLPARTSMRGPVPDSVARQMGYPPLNYSPDGIPVEAAESRLPTAVPSNGRKGLAVESRYHEQDTRGVGWSQEVPAHWSSRHPGIGEWRGTGFPSYGTSPAEAPPRYGSDFGDGPRSAGAGAQHPGYPTREAPVAPPPGAWSSQGRNGETGAALSGYGQPGYREVDPWGTGNAERGYDPSRQVPERAAGVRTGDAGAIDYGTASPGSWQPSGGQADALRSQDRYPPLQGYDDRW